MVVSTTSRPRLQFTRARYDAMVASGILTKDDHVELLNGEVYQKMPKGPKHTARIKALIARLTSPAGPARAHWLPGPSGAERVF